MTNPITPLPSEPALQGESSTLIRWARLVVAAANQLIASLIAAATAIGTVRTGTSDITTTLDGPAFSVVLSTDQTISPAAFTFVHFDTAEFDTAGAFNLGAWAFNPKVAGYYQINFTIVGNWGTPPAIDFRAQIWKNGTVVKQPCILAPSVVGGFASESGSALVFMNGTTDVLQLVGYMNASAGTFKYTSGATNTTFSGHLARRA